MPYQIHVIDVKNSLKNYIWMIEDTSTHEVVIIDPTEAQLVLNYCEQHALIPTQIWITHWHKDHTGGIQALLAETTLPIYAPRDELSKIPSVTHALQHEDQIQFNELVVDIIATPGHTLGHICYFIDELDSLFCGDTLFAMGCGRVFEGTFEQMYHSLNRLAALPPRTKVYCTHEYTLANAQFAITIEPHNIELQERMQSVQTLRAEQQMTLPSTIQLELDTNPFLRTEDVEEFTRIRKLKDQF